MAKSKSLADPRIKQFCELINRGIDAWVRAGELLCKIVDDNPNAYVEILSDNPHLTSEILESFERIGRKEIYPYLLADGSPGARRLAGLDYASQVKIYNARVAVVIRVKGALEERRKRVCELTAGEASLVFDVNRMRPVKEQMDILRAPKRIVAGRMTNGHENEPAEILNESPRAALIRVLTSANDLMLEARTSLILLKGENGLDDYITKALKAIGELRFRLK